MVDIDTLALAVTHQILGVDHVAPYVRRKARIQYVIIDALRAFASATAWPPVPDRGAVKNDPKVVAKLLRCVAAGSYAKENATEHIFNAAADLIDPPLRDDVISYFYVKQGYIFKRPVRVGENITMGFPVCLVCDGVDAEQVCAILNRGEPATE